MLLTSHLSRDRTTPALRTAATLGFAGESVMLRPGAGPVDAWTVLPLLAAVSEEWAALGALAVASLVGRLERIEPADDRRTIGVRRAS